MGAFSLIVVINLLNRLLFVTMTKGTTSFGRRNKKVHMTCRRCGNRSYHIQKKRCAACGYPDKKMRSYNWSEKAKRRRTQGVGKMKHLRRVQKRFRSGFKDGRKGFFATAVAAGSGKKTAS